MTVEEFFDAIRNFTDTVYDIDVTNKFKKQVTLAFKRSLDLGLLKDVVHILAKNGKLEDKHRPHMLTGFSEVVWEAHIRPNWLLTWKYDNGVVLILLETGTHSDLF
jgi:mRNA interferase YafQ